MTGKDVTLAGNSSQILYDQIRRVLLDSQRNVSHAVNTAMVHAYFEVGRLIVEDEQHGEARAEYGKETLTHLSKRLTSEFGRGFSRQNLQNMKQFYLCFQNCHTLSGKLSWSHYILLMRLDDEQARKFYLREVEIENWSVRELDRQINSLLFERLALSRDKKQVKDLAELGQILESPIDMVKDPYVLEFLGLHEQATYTEKELETTLIDNLQSFLLELGKGFTFVSRQKRMTLDAEHFYVDLVFYNRLLRCFVLIDLKIGKLKHQDLGQMQMYVNYFDREVRAKDEERTIGIILCHDKKETIARYTLPDNNTQIFASKYKLYLPTEDELIREVDEVAKKLEGVEK
ncbi:MAG: PDDEXK nuclease domain-containing protein [Desulfobacterales bacterium]|nr:PDDEXK nuclease domain-containing protein [Methanosarcinales archaeon]MCD4777648.1 PDDEXK nuclease domain-containing protein [Desulfobacterales bacterium]